MPEMMVDLLYASYSYDERTYCMLVMMRWTYCMPVMMRWTYCMPVMMRGHCSQL